MSKHYTDDEIRVRIRAVMEREECSKTEAVTLIIGEIIAEAKRRSSQSVVTGATGAKRPLEILRARPFGHLVERVNLMQWGVIITYRGTEAELIKHNRCPARAFREIGTSAQKTVRDGDGNRYYLHRRAKGMFVLEVRLEREPGRGERCAVPKQDLSPIWTQLGIGPFPDKFPEGPLAKEGAS